MYPLLSITNPVPVAPPSFVSASIDTTDGITRFAISATDPGARSIESDVREIFIDSRKNTWAISGLGDVYKYNANGWKKVFDYYVQQKDRTTLGSLTSNFNECDSAIIFSSFALKANNRTTIDKSGSTTILLA